MKIGDLVNFYTTSWVFHRAAEDYKGPGIIIGKTQRSSPISSAKKTVFKILWADLKITNEHECYLKLVSTTNTNSKKVL